MTALWMLYATVVSALLGAAAWAAERALARLGWARRGAWAVAVAGALVLPGAALWRATRAPAVVSTLTIPVMTTGTAARPNLADIRPTADAGEAHAGWRARVATAARHTAAAVVQRGTAWATLAREPLARWDAVLLAGWAAASAIGLLVLARAAWAVRRGRQAWKPWATSGGAGVDGAEVWVTPGVGPAVVGFVRPAVVLPPWAFALPDADLALVLAHEAAHARARDPLLVGLAFGALVAAPWNPALWFAARRLRLAVEADCDRRVLRRHPNAGRRYARLLVDVAERSLGARRPAGLAGVAHAALLDPPGLLEWRVRLLVNAVREDRAPGGRRVVAAGLAGVGAAVAAAAACAAPAPQTPAPQTSAPRAPARAPAPSRRVDAGARRNTSDTVDAVARDLAVARALLDSADVTNRRATARADSTVRALRTQLEVLQLARVRVASDSVPRRLSAQLDSLLGRLPDRDTAQLADVVRRLSGMTRQLQAQTRALDTASPPADPFATLPGPSALRALVAEHAPAALTGGLGPKPFVWFLVDADGRVRRTATGKGGLVASPADFMSRPGGPAPGHLRATDDQPFPAGHVLVLDSGAAEHKFPGVRRGDVAASTWTNVPAGADTVNVIYVTPRTPPRRP